MNDHSDRQEALGLIQIADVASVLEAIRQVADAVHRIQPSEPPVDVGGVFLKTRKVLLHKLLEDMEQTNPAKAAQLQAVIDKYCTNHPFDYE